MDHSWLWQLVASFSLQRPRRSHMGFQADGVALGAGLLQSTYNYHSADAAYSSIIIIIIIRGWYNRLTCGKNAKGFSLIHPILNYSSICLEGLWETMKNHFQESWCPTWDSNQEWKCKSRALPLNHPVQFSPLSHYILFILNKTIKNWYIIKKSNLRFTKSHQMFQNLFGRQTHEYRGWWCQRPVCPYKK